MNVNNAQPQQRAIHAVNGVRRLLEQMFYGYTGNVSLRLWDGEVIPLGRGRSIATLVIRSNKLLRALAWRPDPLRLAEAYFSGEIDVEGDLYGLLMQKDHLQSLQCSLRERISLISAGLFSGGGPATAHHDIRSPRFSKPVSLRVPQRKSKTFNRHAIAFHYDVSNNFYKLWLDEQMVYSCAYFKDPSQTLDQAQADKLDHICRKLRLKPGERLLDVGCGWGALIFWAARHYGVLAHGITLSGAQCEYAKHKIREMGLQTLVTVELCDYRDLSESQVFDKVSSIGMFEHVGLKNLPTYFRAIRRVLKPGGLLLNHGITNDEEGGRRTVGSAFMQRYVFPDGELESVSNVQRVMEQNGFEIWDVEALRPHYALTLRHWVSRLEARKKDALEHVNEATYRVWRLYMAACAVQFESGAIGVYQILTANRQSMPVDLPLTRQDLYRESINS